MRELVVAIAITLAVAVVFVVVLEIGESGGGEETARRGAVSPSDGDREGDGARPGAVGCEGQVDNGAEVSVELSEFAVEPDSTSAPSGEIAFTARNVGAISHELVVIRTDLAPDALPVEGGEVTEGELDVAAKVDEFAAGACERVSVTLEPGSYVLICNIPGHYQLDMRAAFTVQ